MLHTLDFKTDDGSPDGPPMRDLIASIESVIAGVARNETPSGHPWKSSLAGFGSAAAIGGASIGLIVLASALAGIAPHLRSADAFGFATIALFLASVLGFGQMLVRVILTFVASRQR
jgi:hypothetical protein